MNRWVTIRKGGKPLYLVYGDTYANTLLGYSFQFRCCPHLEIRFDLSPNLRVRSKQSKRYCDARELANGAIADLNLLQFDNDTDLEPIAEALDRLPEKPQTWKLTLHLDRDWSFSAKPEVSGSPGARLLSLHVVDRY